MEDEAWRLNSLRSRHTYYSFMKVGEPVVSVHDRLNRGSDRSISPSTAVVPFNNLQLLELEYRVIYHGSRKHHGPESMFALIRSKELPNWENESQKNTKIPCVSRVTGNSWLRRGEQKAHSYGIYGCLYGLMVSLPSWAWYIALSSPGLILIHITCESRFSFFKGRIGASWWQQGVEHATWSQ